MLYLETYKRLGLKDENEVFDYFINNLKHSNRTFEYFIDWGKVFCNIENIEIELNMLNYLIGKENIQNEFKKLIKEYPSVVSTIPILVAVREKSMEVLVDFKGGNWRYKNYSFKKKRNYSDDEINDIIEFCDNIGLLKLFSNKKIKNILDYCIGLEVGIGTNGRKNRSGKIMENIIEWYIKEICKKLKLDYISQATGKKIKKKWSLDLPIDKSSRHYDFAINNKQKLILIETNFYSSGGSKLKSVSGEFRSLNDFLMKEDIVDKFIWITDGIGWKSSHKPLRETFENNDYLLNTKLISDGALEEIINL
ncbi:type II restriction endonuclease [Anaerosalibacter massiliensis]|uniref:Type-2 restriction enzyme n=1 Tax=Anaerosalibacter massiliensis TaxID=1347392 RepID=A0A9X2S6Z7_9FIRM|nr:type II restriction endonuclease [Anaerosalibacter massiliensis]MCR2043651.1 type II restriction endonuclease [Anaerosalibacter massiliensis]